MASPRGSGQQQTKYESETPSHGLRFADKASRIFRGRRPLRLSGRLGTLPFRLAPGTKCRQISELPNREHTRELCPRGRPTSSHGRQSVPCLGGSAPRSGTGRRNRAQMEPESATRRAGRFVARKAIPIRIALAPQSGHGRQSVTSLGGSAPRSGTRRMKRAQTQPESATRRAARFLARKAIPDSHRRRATGQ
jgi:hypothetical protein